MDEKNIKKFLPVNDCPVRNILSRIGDKWVILVMVALESNGIMRFGDLQRSIGDISQRMLTVTLRTLEADGLVDRKVFAEIPPRVEYKLTPRGLSLMDYLNPLIEWAQENSVEIMRNRSGASPASL